MLHKPVLVKEILEYLNPKPNENFIDATIGEGGHTIEILKKNGPDGKVLGIDWDESQIKNAKENIKEFKERIILENDSYANLKEIIEKENFGSVDGILLDIGMSSWQLESGKGFSFMKDEPLDMRYNGEIPNYKSQITNELTAEKIVNEWSENEIEKILREYGEEKFSKKIAKKITEERKINKIKSTFELRDIIAEAMPKRFQHGRIHYATRTFQAIRIAVNHELDNLIEVLPKAIEILSSGGRLVVISFHSLEDRIVKNFFKKKSEEGLVKILTKKPITADQVEILINPRSRSAKLRAIMKITN